MKRIALTFDDGPGLSTQSVLDTLNAHNAKASFFMVGINVVKSHTLVQEIHRSGHMIGNHTMTHPLNDRGWGIWALVNDDTTQAAAIQTFTNEIVFASNAINDAIPDYRPRFFRTPQGFYFNPYRTQTNFLEQALVATHFSPLPANSLHGGGAYAVGWNLDDSDWDPLLTSDEIIAWFERNVYNNPSNSLTVLCHDTYNHNGVAMKTVIPSLIARGWTLVRADELLGVKDTLRPGVGLWSNQSIVSQNGEYRLVFQDNGNLVVYHQASRQNVWSTTSLSENKAQGGCAVMQADGNFVVYDRNYKPLYDSDDAPVYGDGAANGAGYMGMGGAENATLKLNDDGTISIISVAGKEIWRSIKYKISMSVKVIQKE